MRSLLANPGWGRIVEQLRHERMSNILALLGVNANEIATVAALQASCQVLSDIVGLPEQLIEYHMAELANAEEENNG